MKRFKLRTFYLSIVMFIVLLYLELIFRMLNNIDALVDGKFVEEKKNIRLKFRGSENQRIIDLNKTRAEKRVALLDI